MGVIQPVNPEFPGDCCGHCELRLLLFGVCEQCSLSLCSPRCRAVFFQRSRCAVHARLFQERVRVLPAAAAGSPRGAGARCTPEPPASPGTGFWRPGVVGTGYSVRHRVEWPCRRVCPRVSPLGAQGCSAPALAALLPWRLRALLLGSWSILACTLQCHEMLNYSHSYLPSVISQIWLLWLLAHFIQLHGCDFLVLTL